ncbi:phage tail protein [Sporolactobacillus laevolacticus]|uniref:Peptidase S74 domain-containing protein n=1 Tax=Sporolactobacillus laevolacticus DSM 442 TaxID=1395513 RepID=V6IVF2_9BACL|nr:phage tail protein [Sporolactobacillus laevolacticus]EST11100.1 hypothetical protein P343_12605 [Sporolactobacillus laevolacticus DSM 442]
MLTPLYIRSPVGARERLTDYIVERDVRTDGTKQLTVTVYLTQKNQHAFSLLQNQCVFGYLDEEYVIKQVTKNLPNQIQCTAISKFFEDLDSNFIYTTTSGDLSIQQMLDYCLAGTGYSHSVDTNGIAATFAANSFGNSDSLSLFQQVMTDFGTEFAVNGNQIIIAQQIARKTDNQFRYKMNLVSPTNTIDTSSLRTYIRAFGHQYEDGTYAAQIEYTSPLASVYGIKAANPVTDDNCFDNDTLMNQAKAALNDSIPISLSFNYTQVKKMGIQDIQLGDYCFVKIDPWGINASIRVVEIKDYADPNTPPVYTLGNVLTRGTDSIIFANKTANTAVIIARSANSKADAAYASADGKSTIYRGQDQPIDPKVGDSWYVTDNDNDTIAIKSWNGLSWVTDIDINGVDQSVAQAQQDATNAVNQANAAISQAGNAITQAQQAINTANSAQSAADDANQSVVTLTQTVNGLSTQVSNKVDTSTYNSYTAQTANTIATLLTKTDAANTYATQTALTATSSSLTSSITAVQNNLNNLQIGGQNLASKSTDFSTANGWASFLFGGSTGSITATKNTDTFNGQPTYHITASGTGTDKGISKKFVLETSRTYTVSLYYRIASSQPSYGAANGIPFLTNYAANTGLSGFSSFVKDGNWHRATLTVITTDGGIGIRITMGGFTDIDIALIQIQEGNKATDWLLAPADTATQSQITQLANDINLRVSKDDVINQINVSTESILIAGNKVHITGQTTIDNAVITDAMIESVSATKLNVAQLSAIAADLGNVTAGNITGVNITGTTITGSQINGESITSGIISSDRIAANSVTAQQIMVGDFTNLCINPNFQDASGMENGYGWWGGYAYTSTGDGGSPTKYYGCFQGRDSHCGSYFAVTPGEKFYCSFFSWCSGAKNGNFNLGLHCDDGNGGNVQWIVGTNNWDGTHRSNEGILTIPSGCYRAWVWVQIDQFDNFPQWWATNVVVRRAMRGNLIVDGTIQGVNIVGSSFYQNANGYETWLDGNGFHQHTNQWDAWIHSGYVDLTDIYGNWSHLQPFDGIRIHGEDGNESHMSPTVVETSGTMYSQHGFVNTSRVELKTDITALDDNIGLSLINSLDVYKFKYKSQIESGQIKEIYGAIIGEGYNLPDEFIDYNRQGVNLYSSIFIAIKSIQELTKLHQQDVLKIAELESRISLLEGAAA